MANYLVTGAAGFIGSHLAKTLIEQGGHTCTTIDNLSTGFEVNIHKGCTFIKGDTFDKNVIAKLDGQKFDAIFHMAGQSGGMTSFDNPVYDLDSNVASTLLLLNYAKETGCKTFIYASSMSVYGDQNPCPVTEASGKLQPKTFYAVGKIASENYMKMYSDQFGIKCTALRFNNTYGRGQNMENLRQGMVSIFIAMAIRDRHIHVLGDKNRFRDFVHVSDTVSACILAEKGNEDDLFNVYNVATNRKTTCEELIDCMRVYFPFKITAEYKGSTPGDQFGIFCDYSKINNAIGWEPKVKLEDGLKDMIEWALTGKK